MTKSGRIELMSPAGDFTSLQAAIDNDQIKKLEILAQQYKKAHTQKVREYKKIGRNDPCPCGSGQKYKNCCLKSGKYEQIVDKNN